MSERFYEHFLSLFANSIMLLGLIIGTLEFLLLYIWNPNVIFYFCYLVLIISSGVFGIRYVRIYRNLKDNLGCFFPENKIEPLKIEVEGLPLKVCLFYQQGATFMQIKDDLGLGHPTQVTRELRKGLSILLKEHNEKVKMA